MARYSTEHKDNTRDKIVHAAAKEFRSKGWAGATIPGIMETAGMTVGGFYKHFESKSELFAEMFGHTFRKSSDRATALKDSSTADNWRKALAESYLDHAHRNNMRGGCVMAALASDMPRATTEARRAYEDELKRYTAHLVADSSDPAEQAKVWALQAMMLGGLMMARSVESEKTAHEIMDSCQKVIREEF